MHITNFFSKFKSGLEKAISSKPIVYVKAQPPANRKPKPMTQRAKPTYKLSDKPSDGIGVGP